MNDISPIEAVVMRRVRRIALLRILISGGILAFALALLALYGLGREVWVARVFENGPHGFFPGLGYLVYAFLHTRFVVQGLCVVAFASFLFLAREVVRLFSRA
jgi:hypothetical protein